MSEIEFPENNPEPTPPDNKITKLAFRARFTLAEKIAIVGAKKTDPITEILMDDLVIASYIDLDRVDLQEGVYYLYTVDLITAGRAAEILSTENITEAERWNG